MLEGLDDIDWKHLQHAYGTAEDVPELMRALISEEKAQRDRAVYELFGKIWHQGTIYEASAPAVPFLIELLESTSTPDPAPVACLLASVAAGSGYLDVHVRCESEVSMWRDILAKEGKTLEEEFAQERAVTNSVRREAANALPILAPYLSHQEPEIRSSVAAALSAYPDHRATYLPLLKVALTNEADVEVREEIRQGIAILEATQLN